MGPDSCDDDDDDDDCDDDGDDDADDDVADDGDRDDHDDDHDHDDDDDDNDDEDGDDDGDDGERGDICFTLPLKEKTLQQRPNDKQSSFPPSPPALTLERVATEMSGFGPASLWPTVQY